MGESTRTEREANAATAEFIRICETVRNQKLNATISLDLSHIGLAISKELCLNNLDDICREASKANQEVIISAEDASRTDAVLNTYLEISKLHQHVGITLQAYLFRTKDDFEEVVKCRGRIRMVKGAFETPSGLSLPRGEALDNLYLDYVDKLLARDHLCSIATHHQKIQDAVKKMVRTNGVDNTSYEFESLFGIQNQQLVTLKEEGFPAKIYFVYGKEWYLYLCNRLAEYPINVLQALKDILAA